MKDGELNRLAEQVCDWVWGNVCTMEGLLEATRRDGLERGVSFCKTDGRFEATEQCTGTYCSVALPSCPESKEMVGSYHTHPNSTPDFSPQDYISSQNANRSIHCVGTTLRTKEKAEGVNMIKCEKLNPDISEEAETEADFKKIDDMQDSLTQAAEAVLGITGKVKKGQAYKAEYESYKAGMDKFLLLASGIGYIKPCSPPRRKGDWHRKI